LGVAPPSGALVAVRLQVGAEHLSATSRKAEIRSGSSAQVAGNHCSVYTKAFRGKKYTLWINSRHRRPD
jgi:hypothetical protein